MEIELYRLWMSILEVEQAAVMVQRGCTNVPQVSPMSPGVPVAQGCTQIDPGGPEHPQTTGSGLSQKM